MTILEFHRLLRRQASGDLVVELASVFKTHADKTVRAFDGAQFLKWDQWNGDDEEDDVEQAFADL